jgi:hypothetical protein
MDMASEWREKNQQKLNYQKSLQVHKFSVMGSIKQQKEPIVNAVKKISSKRSEKKHFNFQQCHDSYYSSMKLNKT